MKFIGPPIKANMNQQTETQMPNSDVCGRHDTARTKNWVSLLTPLNPVNRKPHRRFMSTRCVAPRLRYAWLQAVVCTVCITILRFLPQLNTHAWHTTNLWSRHCWALVCTSSPWSIKHVAEFFSQIELTEQCPTQPQSVFCEHPLGRPC